MRPELPELVYAGEGQEQLGEVLNSILAELHYWRGLVGTGGATVNLRTDRPVIAGGPGGNSSVLIKTKTAISGRSGTTPGTGTVYLVSYDGTSLATGAEATVLNWSQSGAAADRYGQATRIGPHLWLSNLECG